MPIYTGPALREDYSIDDLLGSGLTEDPDSSAIVSSDVCLTWRELDERVSRLVGAYHQLGLKPGDRVASLLPNSHLLIIHYLACLKAGFVATPLNYRYTASEIEHAMMVSGAAMIVCHQEREFEVAAHRPRVIAGALADVSKIRMESLLESGDPAIAPESVGPEHLAFLYFTSGSTGMPKAVAHTRETFKRMICSTIQSLMLSPRDTLLPASSLSHIGGSLFAMASLVAGANVVISPTVDGPTILPLLRRYRPTVLWMLPVALVQLVRDAGTVPEDFSSVRICFSGGDRVSSELEQEFTDVAGFPIHESYGMTEIGMAAINPPDEADRIGSVGRLCPGMLVELRDEEGRQVPVGNPGRMWVQSATNAIGYWEDAKATRSTIVDGWLDTGDLMRIDDDGYLWFCGRKKQIIIHDGSNICPQEVEAALAEHPAIDEVGVTGVRDIVHGENVCAFVKLRPAERPPSVATLIEFARERIGYKAPENIVFVESMPLNSAGKIDRVALGHATPWIQVPTASRPSNP